VIAAPQGQRRIWLCADDYGISPAVNSAIRDLVVRGHLNATSAMVPAPSCNRSEARALNMLNATAPQVAIGLHVTLTAPFRPISKDFAPLRDGAFLPLAETLRTALMRRFRRAALDAEIEAQLRAFIDLFGRAPDFVDGHQHVQLFPQLRDAVLRAMSRIAPKAWARQCGRSLPLLRRFADRKGLLLDLLSRGFRRRAQRLGLRTNPGFAGTYDYAAPADFATLFPRFLERLPDGGVVMCHPGFVDAELQRLDPLTHLREREYAFFAQGSFPDLLAAQGVTLAGSRP
jgi:predicted glycoside hydrolase/deacetylase ChbG (UPF0249 family)